MKQTHCLRDKMFPRVVYIYCESFQSQGVKQIFFFLKNFKYSLCLHNIPFIIHWFILIGTDLSLVHSSPDGWRLLKKERFMKMKAKLYTLVQTNTNLHPFGSPLMSHSVS
ncbi:hypothetical protein ILYODFUR_012414 [Ilyodon furcidens]|uniref:Uncharacterized protein n=1 Tax=Ilyodon furcidens TaxID=33524 RepID=A0ABV0URD4_9TELE